MNDWPDPPKPRVAPTMEPLTCPACAAELYTNVGVEDVVICVACRAMVIFDVDYEIVRNWPAPPRAKVTRAFLRYPTEDEEVRHLADPNVQHLISHVAAHHARYGSPHPRTDPPDDGRPPY